MHESVSQPAYLQRPLDHNQTYFKFQLEMAKLAASTHRKNAIRHVHVMADWIEDPDLNHATTIVLEALETVKDKNGQSRNWAKQNLVLVRRTMLHYSLSGQIRATQGRWISPTQPSCNDSHRRWATRKLNQMRSKSTSLLTDTATEW